MLAPDLPGGFGAGDEEPYALALHDPARSLTLETSDGAAGSDVDVRRFLEAADDVDLAAITDVPGPVIDVGCGPGRMVRAAALAGYAAMGIDISAAAVAIARRHGLAVLRRSVYDELPGAGRWGTVLLLDGNIGIGGDPTALLRRCRALVRPASGRIVVETHADPRRDRRFDGRVVDDLGRGSRPFPWAEVGSAALRRYADAAGLAVLRERRSGGRVFAECGSR